MAAIPGALAILVASGCQGTQTPASTMTTSVLSASKAPATTTVDPMAAAQQNALRAYRGMWAAYQDAIRVPDPASPALARYAAGEALTTLREGLQSVKDQNLKAAGELRLSPTVTDMLPVDRPTSVTVHDCFDDSDTHLVRIGRGTPHNDKPGGRRLCIATVTAGADGVWKVTSFGLREVGTCT